MCVYMHVWMPFRWHSICKSLVPLTQMASDATYISIAYIYTHVNMFTGDQITDSARRNIEILHEATLGNLIKTKNSTIWYLLIERNQALRER